MNYSVQSQVLNVSGNYAVVKLDQRRFPGVMMQGDTFHSLVRDLAEAEMAAGGSRKTKEILERLLHTLRAVEGFYEKTTQDKGFQLPY